MQPLQMHPQKAEVINPLNNEQILCAQQVGVTFSPNLPPATVGQFGSGSFLQILGQSVRGVESQPIDPALLERTKLRNEVRAAGGVFRRPSNWPT